MFKRFFQGGGQKPPENDTPRSPHHDAIRAILQTAIAGMMSRNPLFTFKDAFLDKPGFIQRDKGDLQQVIDQANGINFELEDQMLLIALRDEQTARVVASVEQALHDIFGRSVALPPVGGHPSMPNLHSTEFRASPNALHEYTVAVYAGEVPGTTSGSREAGNQIALRYALALPGMMGQGAVP